MKDVIIPYRKNYSGELDACIALIKKNVPHRNIYVVEDYEQSTYSAVPHINTTLKLDWALKNLDITEEFYLFNDDFFVLEPVIEIPYMHRGTLENHIATRLGNDHYTRALKTTLEWLSPSFESPLSYETHVPFLFNKSLLKIAIASLHSGIESGKCPLIRSWYGNTTGVEGTEVADVKNVRHFANKTYLSTTENSFLRQPIGNYIRSKI